MYFYPLTRAIILIVTVMLSVLHHHGIHRQLMHELEFSGEVRLRNLMLLIAGTSTEIDRRTHPNQPTPLCPILPHGKAATFLAKVKRKARMQHGR